MNANVMTAHAMVRAQQRGIPNDVIDWVLRCIFVINGLAGSLGPR
jgi:hypothetical protein